MVDVSEDTAANVDLDTLRNDWVGFEFDRADFTVELDELLNWAEACGESDPRFTDPANPDFQAHPAFTTKYQSQSHRMFPENFPALGPGGIDGGKSVEVHGPIHPGDRLHASAQIADIYDKTGRSGTMIFVVHRMSFTNQDGELVSTVDTKMIRPVGR